jgi:hypothetical protein
MPGGSTRRVRPAQPAAGGGSRRLAATIARWPLEVEDGFSTAFLPPGDQSISIVRQSIDDYRSGRADRAAQSWHDEIIWRVLGDGRLAGEWIGPEKVFAYHRLAERLADGDFSQRLIALEGSHGVTVNAYLRTTATRRGRRLDIPTLAMFELVGGRIRCVTEVPGDREAWRDFWR